jgi:hypothetical protein
MKPILSLLCVLLLGVGIGCASLSEYLTPATVDQKAVAYAAEAGVADANDFAGYANLDKATRLRTAVDSAYQVKTLALNQMLEKGQLDYNVLKGIVTNNAKLAQQREEQLFGETGLLSMGLSLLGVGGLGGLIGLSRKRPGDITPQEMESALVELKGSVSDKERQMIEVVKGVQGFIDANKDDESLAYMVKQLKTYLNDSQSVDTKQVVAAAKAVLS